MACLSKRQLEVTTWTAVIPLGRVAGFPLTVHWSVLVILWLFTWSLAATLPDTAPGHPSIVYWLAGITGAVVLLASLLAHELTHAIIARREGVKVLGVKLWLFGGIARLGGEAKTPGTEFRIAASGPAMSLALAAVFAGAAAALRARRDRERGGRRRLVAGRNQLDTGAIQPCCPVRRWMVAGYCAPTYGAGTATRYAPLSARHGPDASSPTF